MRLLCEVFGCVSRFAVIAVVVCALFVAGFFYRAGVENDECLP